MAQPTYLDLAGLTTYDGLIKAEISGKIDVGGKAGQIPFGRVDSTSTSTAFTATVDGVTELVDGTCVMLHNGVVTSASGFTVNVNGLGAKPVYNNLATGNDVTPTEPTRDTTIFNINYTMLFVYDSQLEGGAWVCYRGYDANTNTIGYQLRTNSGRRPASDTGYRYRIWLTSPDGAKWVPINTSSATNATSSRTLNTRAIDPFGPIAYNSTNGTCNSGSNLPAATMWRVYTLTIGYSYVKSLTAWESVYLKCLPSTDGSAVMKDVVQALPTSKDGFIYILLGTAYSATGMELQAEHPVYWHDGTGIRLWTGAELSSGGSSVTVDSELSTTSTNPVQNKVVKAAVDGKVDSTGLAAKVTSSIQNNGVFSANASLNSTGQNSKVEAAYAQASLTSYAEDSYNFTRVRVRADYAEMQATGDDGDAFSSIVVRPSGITIDNVVAPTTSTMPATKGYVDTAVGAKQATLVSGTNIKTINNQSLLGSGNISISSGGGSSWTDISSLAWVQSIGDAAIIQAKTDGFLVVFCAMVSGLDIGNYPLTIFTPSGYKPAVMSMAPFTDDSTAPNPLGYATAFPESGAISVDITNADYYDPENPFTFTFTLIYPIA